MQIAMIGTGYVGLVTGTCFAEIGHTVTCVDNNQSKVDMLRDGRSPIYEPGIEDMIRRNVTNKRLGFESDLSIALKNAKVAFIAVGTPEGEDGSADLGYVRGVADEIGKTIDHDLLVVVKSTVPVGTCDLVERIILENLAARNLQVKVTVASNPEFLKEGDAIKDFMRPDRIVVGVTNDQDGKTFEAIYKPFIFDDPTKLLVMDRRSSELTKYGANAMLATRISFMNELSQLCERLGADIDNIRRGMGSDPRIGKKFLYAGPGYGGSCFPKDVHALLRTGQKHGVDFSILAAVTKANDNQKQRVAEKIRNYFHGQLEGRTIAVWGLAFKPGTDDVREAPAETIISNLLKWGAKVQAHDPQAIETFRRCHDTEGRVSFVDHAEQALEGADALVLLTEWSEYRRPDWNQIRSVLGEGKVVFDFRNQYESNVVRNVGLKYESIGRSGFEQDRSPL